ncbi:hypothetical protein BFW87_26730 [Pseudomonas fluorescens]|uniref:N-acetyltransferase domain-containing protein n=1 Tax=Pseudomonas fluorescens TaxID=294 RepID=A0A1T2Y2P1_PSEFL|nr:GNAT family N-acetyltransferase [Pseudomonas fluorescens]OPA86336.1 hypothetical protein BFW87_26730 [Pseudomonas fluorescens]
MRDYFLTSSRLGFGHWQPDDLALLDSVFGDPVVTRYEGGDWSRQQIEDRLLFEISNFDRYHIQYWPVFLKDTGEYVGCCGVRPHDLAQGVLEFGCQLRRAFWSRQLGREAGEAVIAYAFKDKRVQALYAGHHPDNIASSEFLRHLGFAHTHDELYALTGLMEPCYLLTRSRFSEAALF